MSVTYTIAGRQSSPTSLVWGCGHTAPVILAIDAVKAAEQIAAYIQIDCLPCAKAKKLSSSSINDVGAR